jgi:hypothetical protein
MAGGLPQESVLYPTLYKYYINNTPQTTSVDSAPMISVPMVMMGGGKRAPTWDYFAASTFIKHFGCSCYFLWTADDIFVYMSLSPPDFCEAVFTVVGLPCLPDHPEASLQFV